MVQKTRLATLLGLSGALLMSGVAHAQNSVSPASAPGYSNPSSYRGASSASGSTAPTGVGTVDSAQTIDSSTVTSDVATDASTLPATGGEPWLFAFGGLTLAAGALTLRRRIN